MLSQLNQQWFLAFNASSDLHGFSLYTAIFAAKYLIYVALLILAALWLWGSREQKQAVLSAALSAIAALVVSFIIGHLWFHPRPFAVGLGHQYLAHSPDSSFPSDHVTFLAAISLTLLVLAHTRLVGFILFLMTLCVAWARVYVGIHYPFDMLGALWLGLLTTILVLSLKKPIDDTIFPHIEKLHQKIFAIFSR